MSRPATSVLHAHFMRRVLAVVFMTDLEVEIERCWVCLLKKVVSIFFLILPVSMNQRQFDLN